MELFTEKQLERHMRRVRKGENARLNALAAEAAVNAAAIKLEQARARLLGAQVAVAEYAGATAPETLHIAQWDQHGNLEAACGSGTGAAIKPATAATCEACRALFNRSFRGPGHA